MPAPRLAYVVSRFPLLTETFILHEVLTLGESGWPVEVFALCHEHQSVVHAAARQLEPWVHYPATRPMLADNLRLITHRPRLWTRLLATTVTGNARSPRFLAKSLLVLPIAISWARQMQILGVHHVHAHFGSYPALAALLAAEILGIGFSFTVHAHDLFADNVMLAEKAHRARFVVTISEFNRQRLSTLLQPDDARRICVIHCGVDPTAFRFKPSDPRPLHRHVVVSVAALREYKGLEYLIRACALLRDAAPDVPFVCQIVGEGPERARLEHLIHTCGLEESVQLMGAHDERGVHALLEESDTFVLPSVEARNGYMDGIPVSLMEAMASGVPVIASNLSGIPELVRDGDTGLLVPAGNPEAIRDAILGCWQYTRATAERALRARALVEREYDLRANATLLAQVFEHALAKPSDVLITAGN
jgi:colanic acid/amylovoran biosynthesis glycosyltransferase